MNLAGAIFLVAAFLVLAFWLRIPSRAGRAIRLVREAVAVLRDPDLDDDTKERTMQATSKQLFVLFGVLTLLSIVALAIPVGLLYGADRLGWLSFDGVMTTTISWQFLVAATVLSLIAWMLLARRTSA